MALFAVYRLINRDSQLHILFYDIRQSGKELEHFCVLPDHEWLIREISDQLETMGFELEQDEKLDAKDELRITAQYTIPGDAGSSAEAIRAVCSRHALTAEITTGEGKGLMRQLQV